MSIRTLAEELAEMERLGRAHHGVAYVRNLPRREDRRAVFPEGRTRPPRCEHSCERQIQNTRRQRLTRALPRAWCGS